MAESIGERLASRYLLLRPLGAGGMGTVWLARDEMLDREVAVKELRVPEGMGERERAELVTRVMREAEVTARLRHPAVVSVHDVLVEDGRPWIVMERLNGRSLLGRDRRPRRHAGRARSPRSRPGWSTRSRRRTPTACSTATSSRGTCSSRSTGGWC